MITKTCGWGLTIYTITLTSDPQKVLVTVEDPTVGVHSAWGGRGVS